MLDWKETLKANVSNLLSRAAMSANVPPGPGALLIEFSLRLAWKPLFLLHLLSQSPIKDQMASIFIFNGPGQLLIPATVV